MWSPIVHTTINDSVVPSTRCKHAVCFNQAANHVFILGGRNGNIPLKDFWSLCLESGRWTCLSDKIATPISVQEHTMVSWRESLYVFGGLFGPSNQCPLWIFDTKEQSWSCWKSAKNQDFPKDRRAHTTVVHRDFMYIYGGYQDMRGSLSEFWQFSFVTNEWKMIHGNSPKRSSEVIPSARHRHSSIVYDDCIWVYGGMTDLQERSDLWKFDLVSKQWSMIKCKLGPGPLHSHSAIRFQSFMLVIGGEKQGFLSDEVWRFHFGTEIWDRLEFGGQKPSARAQLAVVALDVPGFVSPTTTVHERPKPTTNDDRTKTLIRTRPLLPGTRNIGYQLVGTNADDSDNDVVEEDTMINRDNQNTRLPSVNKPWLSKTYSLLSNASSESSVLDETDNVKEVVSQFFHGQSPNRAKPRSESVHNFTVSTRRVSVPRSMTTVRFNPFDIGHEIKIVETDITTSDYASEFHDSVSSINGIPNPLYDNFVSQMVCEDDDEHRQYAEALNHSTSNHSTCRPSRDLVTQLLRFTTIHNAVHQEPDDKHVSKHLTDLRDNNGCVLTFGGREGGHVTFGRPLSIWMLRL